MQDAKPTIEQAVSSVENDNILRFICPERKDFSHLQTLAETALPGVLTSFDTSLEDALAAPGNNLIIVPIETPTQSLARHLKSKKNFSNALQDWFAETEAFLQNYRKVRRQVRIMAKTLLLSGSTESWQAVAAQVGVPLSAPSPKLAETPPCALSYLLSQYLIGITPKAQTLAKEIEAMINGPCPSLENSPELVAILLKERQAVETENAELQKSQQALDAKQQHTATENNLLKESLSTLLRDIEAQSLRQDTLAKEIKLMGQLEAKLSRSASELLTAQEKATTLEHRVAELSDNLEAIYASNSWQITGPLRKISLLLRPR